MHALGAGVEPHDRVVMEDPEHRGGHGGAQNVADVGTLVQTGRRELGRGERAGAERPHELGSRIGVAGARGTEPLDQRREQRRRCRLDHFQLDLTEAGRHPVAVEHGHLVVGDLGDAVTPWIEQRKAPPHGLQAGHRFERSRARVGTHEVAHFERHLGGRAVEVVLGSRQHAVVDGARQASPSTRRGLLARDDAP